MEFKSITFLSILSSSHALSILAEDREIALFNEIFNVESCISLGYSGVVEH